MPPWGFTVTGIPNEAFSKGFVSVRWVGATLVIVASMLLLYPRQDRPVIQFVANKVRIVRFGTKKPMVWIRCFSRIQWSSKNAAFLQAQAFGGGAQIWESNGLHHGLAVWLVTTISEIAFCLGDSWNHAEPISILCELHMSYLMCTVNVVSWATALSGVKDRYGTQRLRLLCALCGIIPMVIYITAQMISFAAMVEGMTLQLIPKYACMHLESTLSIHNDNFGNWWRTGDFLSPSAAFVIWHESWGWSSACWF